MNFKTAYLEGQKGRNFGLDTGLPNINKALGGVQRKSIYTVAAAPKVGKTAFVDNVFLIYPFVNSIRTNFVEEGYEVEWIYFSYEIDRIKKHFRLLPLFLYKHFGITHYEWKGEKYPLNSMYLEGKLQDNDGEVIKVSSDIEEAIKKVYNIWLIPLFGEYDDNGILLKKGKIDFIEEKMNPTGKLIFYFEFL